MTSTIHDPRADHTADVEQRLDALAEQLAFVTEELAEQRRRRMMWDELRADLAPVAADAMSLATHGFEEIENDFSVEDLARLVKRLARNTARLERTLATYEGALELVEDVMPLTGDAFAKLTTALDELERRGYFEFGASSLKVIDRIITGFTQEDVEHLADNIVLILDTVKDMTQPEIMTMLQRTADVFEEEVETPSLRQIFKQMRDPAVKRGIARFLRVMQSVSDGAASPETPDQTPTTTTAN